MSLMIPEVYDALKEAGASEEKARKAAEVLANHANHFNKIENDLARLSARTDAFEARVAGEFNLVKWLIGFTLAMTVAILWKVFTA